MTSGAGLTRRPPGDRVWRVIDRHERGVLYGPTNYPEGIIRGVIQNPNLPRVHSTDDGSVLKKSCARPLNPDACRCTAHELIATTEIFLCAIFICIDIRGDMAMASWPCRGFHVENRMPNILPSGQKQEDHWHRGFTSNFVPREIYRPSESEQLVVVLQVIERTRAQIVLGCIHPDHNAKLTDRHSGSDWSWQWPLVVGTLCIIMLHLSVQWLVESWLWLLLIVVERSHFCWGLH